MTAPTSEELQLIEIFRRRLINTIDDDDNLRNLGLFQDRQLLRWIRARENDLGKAEEMLKKHLEWRKLNGIGPSLLKWSPPSMLTTTYPVKFMGFDKEGSPIFFLNFGSWDIRQAVDAGHKDAMVRYKDKILEQIMQLMRIYENLSPNKESVTQFIALSDWTGFSLRYIMRKEVVDIIINAARSFEANYPETLKSGFNINCPKVFAVLFNLVKPFLSERTLSKIQIFDSNQTKWGGPLKNMIDSRILPEIYGGTRETQTDDEKIPKKLWDLHNLRLELDDAEIGSIVAGSQSLFASDHVFNGKNSELTNIRIAPGYKVHIPIKIIYTAQVKNELLPYASSTTICNFFVKTTKNRFSTGYPAITSIPEAEVDRRLELFPVERIQGENFGSHICERENGDYALCFDNSYSNFKAKIIEYSVSVDNPFTIT